MDEKRPDIPAPEQPDKGPVQPESRDLDRPVQPAKPRPPQPVEPHSVETGRPPQPQQPAGPLQSGGPQQPAQPNQPAVPPQPGEPQRPQQPAQPQSPTGAQQPNGQQPHAPQTPYDQQPPQFPMGYGGQGPYPPPVPPVYAQGSGGGKAIGALVCGIFAILLSVVPLLGLVLGVIAIVLASKAVKRSGRDGKATAGKVCGIIGIVLAVLSFIFWGVASCAVIALGGLGVDGNTYGTVFESTESGTSDGDLLTVEEEAAQAAAVVELDKLANQDEATVQSLAAELDEGFAEAMGLGHADLGVDPADLARWMLTDFTYEPDGVYVTSDGGGLKATMYADVELRDSYAFMMNFYDKVDALQQSDEITTMTEAEAKARIGELYREAMDETTDMTTWYTAIELEKQGDQWVVDQDAWGDELEGMFGIY